VKQKRSISTIKLILLRSLALLHIEFYSAHLARRAHVMNPRMDNTIPDPGAVGVFTTVTGAGVCVDSGVDVALCTYLPLLLLETHISQSCTWVFNISF